MVSKTRESLDTNVILRIMLMDIPEQCLAIVDLFMRQNYVYDVSDLAVTESVFVMQESCTREEVVANLRKLFELPGINANFNLYKKVFPMYLKHPKLSFNDCCLAAYAELNQAEPLRTFDRKLANQASNAELIGQVAV